MRKKTHKSIFTLHKNINKNKYNKVKRTIPLKDITKEYEIRPDGWRRRPKERLK